MDKLKIVVENERIDIFTPYNPDFVKAIKTIYSAKWDGDRKCWNAPVESLNSVRNIMSSIYGYNDQDTAETVSMRIHIQEDISVLHGDVTFLGKVLSHATGRDSGARAGIGVFYISGKHNSGGSVKNWRSCVEADSVIDLSNVSKTLYDRYLAGDEKMEGIEILSVSGNEIDKTALMEERDRILKRLDEINKLLD